MASIFDETFEEGENRERLERFYGRFSTDVRNRLLTKNIKRPDNLYDVLYTPVRTGLLTKNVPNTITIDSTSTQIRNSLLSKQIEKDIDLDKSGENIRNSLLAKNVLINSSMDMDNMSEAIRNNLLASNVGNMVIPDNGAQNVRNSLLSRNVDNGANPDNGAQNVRNNLLSRNIDNGASPDNGAQNFRNSLLSRNIDNGVSLDNNAETIRKSLLSSNIDNGASPDNNAQIVRNNLLSSNINKSVSPDNGAEQIRNNLLSTNVDKGISPDNGATQVRNNLLSSNINKSVSPDNGATQVRNNLLATNIDKGVSPDNGAQTVRTNLLATNVSKSVTPDNGAEQVRNSLLAINIGKNITPDNGAEQIRNNLLSTNVDKGVSPDNGAQTVRNNLLATNVDNGASPDSGAQTVRNNLLTTNISNGANPDNGAEQVRNNLLSTNVNKGVTPDSGAEQVRNNLLATNVSNGANPNNGAETVRNSLLATNVNNGVTPDSGAEQIRNSLLSINVSNGASPESGAEQIRNSLLATNVSNGASPDNGAEQVRNSLLAINVSNNTTPDSGTDSLRNSLLSNNVTNNATIDDIATSARNNLLSVNVPNNIDLDNMSVPFRDNLLSSNIVNDSPGTNVPLDQTMGVSNLELVADIAFAANALLNSVFTNNIATYLQSLYGTNTSFDGYSPFGVVTSAAQLHNIESNTYASFRYNQGSSEGLNALSTFNMDGFQSLIANTIGGFQRYTQVSTNSTPASVIQQNQGQYLPLGNQGINALLKPDGDGVLGTAQSMVSQTEPSDVIETVFNKQDRGIRHIINTIKNSNISLAKNYDPQNNNSFVIGTNNDGSLKKAFGRFTVANPYAVPTDTSVMTLRLTNYAIPVSQGQTMNFPPYLKSFQHGSSASWNETLFLGRPEPIYTYSNSKRTGTLEFIVLTDYSQNIIIGTNWGQNPTPIVQAFPNHFTDGVDNSQQIANLEAQIVQEKQKLTALYLKKAQSIVNGKSIGGTGSINQQITQEQATITSLETQLNQLTSSPTGVFSENSKINGNIYQSTINGIPADETAPDGNLELIDAPEDTVTKLNTMMQNLLFQPAFFSGDKVDFLRRMEFLEKLTRPAANNQSNGFSFSTPPVAHLKLGDWIDNDIIIESTNFDYSESVWDFNSGRVQPMFCTVTLSFNIVGFYNSKSTDVGVPLSTSDGGFHQTRTS